MTIAKMLRLSLAVLAAGLAAIGTMYFYQRFDSTDFAANSAKQLPDYQSPESQTLGKDALGNDEVVLDQEQRQFIWDVEHHVLVLGKYWFRDVSEAWSRADGAAVQTMLASNFRGQLPAQPEEARLDTGFAQVVRSRDSGKPPRDIDGAEFVSFLLDLRRTFARRAQAKIFAKTLLPDLRQVPNGSWHGVGVARMWGEIEDGKPGEVVLHFEFRIPRPDRNHAGGWLQQVRVLQSQFSRSDRFLLVDVTRQRGVNPDLFHDNWKSDKKVSGAGGVYVCDFNRDGILDFLVVDLQAIQLFQGLPGGRFTDVTARMRLPQLPSPQWSGVYAAFADLDGDGWEDLILAGKVYRNEQGRAFGDVSHRCTLRLEPEATGAVVADYDRDGKVDLYITMPGIAKVAGWLDGKGGRGSGNQLWRNLGDWKFENVTAKSNAAGGDRSVFSAVWFDADDDGWPDLYVPNEFGHGVLLVNRHDGTFQEQIIANLPGDFGTMGISCGDVNNDGKVDLYLANMYSKTGARVIGNVKHGTYPPDVMAKMRRFVSGSQLYLNRGNLQFEPVGQSWQMNDVGWAYGPALIDLDNDGFLDAFATSGFMSFDRSEPDG